MNMTDLAAILAAIAWPLAILALVFYFRTSIGLLLKSIAESLKLRSIKFSLFGTEVELTPDEAKSALDEMLLDIVEAMNELTAEEIELFQAVARADARLTVLELRRGFQRGGEVHIQLRRLRDRKLVRPVEGGKWQPEKHPVITRFGRLVQDLHPQLKKAAGA